MASTDTKNFNIRGDLTVFSNSNISAGKGVISTDFLKETTLNSGITVEDTSFIFTNETNQSVLSFNGGTSTLAIESTNITLDADINTSGTSTVIGNLTTNSALSALSGFHSLVNSASSAGVLRLRNTSSSGYSSVGFYDEVNTERLTIGLGNPISDLFGSSAFINVKAGYSLNIKTEGSSSNSVVIQSNGVVQMPNTAVSSNASTGALVVGGGVGIGGRVNISGGISTIFGTNRLGNLYTIASGEVGIGIENPERLFHVRGNNSILRIDRDTNTCGIQLHRFPTGNFTTPWKGFLLGVNASGLNAGNFFIADYGTSTAGASTQRISVNSGGIIEIFSNIESVSPTSGGLIVAGGIGVGGSISVSGHYNDTPINSPPNPGGNTIRYFTDNTDSLYKSKNSSGVLTTYQPTTTKGDILTHNGTTQTRLPVDVIDDSYLVSNSSTETGLAWLNKAYAYIRDEKSIGTNGGTANNGSFFDKELNTISSYPPGQNFITLNTGNSRITLQPGNYYVKVKSPAVGVYEHCCRIFDWTDLVVISFGTPERTISGGRAGPGDGTSSFSNVIISTSVPKDIGVQHRVNDTIIGTGRGLSSGFQTEVYTTVEVYKI